MIPNCVASPRIALQSEHYCLLSTGSRAENSELLRFLLRCFGSLESFVFPSSLPLMLLRSFSPEEKMPSMRSGCLELKNAVFWNVTPCCCERCSYLADSFTPMKDAIRFSETSVLTRATRRQISEYDILHNHRRENLKS
jgi:hypothetical protein